jgi:hypothetical protein
LLSCAWVSAWPLLWCLHQPLLLLLLLLPLLEEHLHRSHLL